jgi:hypothetical protein
VRERWRVAAEWVWFDWVINEIIISRIPHAERNPPHPRLQRWGAPLSISAKKGGKKTTSIHAQN